MANAQQVIAAEILARRHGKLDVQPEPTYTGTIIATGSTCGLAEARYLIGVDGIVVDAESGEVFDPARPDARLGSRP